MELYYDEMDSPIGPLVLVMKENKLVRIGFGSWDERLYELTPWIYTYYKKINISQNIEALRHVKHELENYFMGKQQKFSIEIEFNGTEFQRKVWKVLNDIPIGETRSYQDIAVSIGNQKAVRAVGGAVNKNPIPIIVPCHRVIGKNGKMVGYNGGIDKKEFLLQHENVYTLH